MLEQKIKKLIFNLVKKLGYELLEIVVSKKHFYKFVIFIDKKNNVNVNDCVIVSNQVNVLLKKFFINLKYSLEVSSPGPERLLLKISHYTRFIGKAVRIILHIPLNNRQEWQGIIKSVNVNNITITKKNSDYIFFFNNIKKANLIALL